jgi:hypothetical protein
MYYAIYIYIYIYTYTHNKDIIYLWQYVSCRGLYGVYHRSYQHCVCVYVDVRDKQLIR